MIINKFKNYIADISGFIFNLNRLISYRKDRYVLSYHRVIKEDMAIKDCMHHSLWVTPKLFESHIAWMKNVGKIVNSEEFFSDSNHDGPLFLITFDDGWRDTYVSAFPILKKCNVPAMVFLATEAVENGFLFWPQDIATKTMELFMSDHSQQVVRAVIDCWPDYNGTNPPSNKHNAIDILYLWIEYLKYVDESVRLNLISDYYDKLSLPQSPLLGYILNWDEIKEMRKNGIEFGSHTHRHVILEDLSVDIIGKELIQSKNIISNQLQCEVSSLCYPNGRYSGLESDILHKCGYLYGFCLDNKSLRYRQDYFYVPRFIMNERNSRSEAYLKMRLLEAPLFRSKSHRPKMENM